MRNDIATMVSVSSCVNKNAWNKLIKSQKESGTFLHYCTSMIGVNRAVFKGRVYGSTAPPPELLGKIAL